MSRLFPPPPPRARGGPDFAVFNNLHPRDANRGRRHRHSNGEWLRHREVAEKWSRGIYRGKDIHHRFQFDRALVRDYRERQIGELRGGRFTHNEQ